MADNGELYIPTPEEQAPENLLPPASGNFRLLRKVFFYHLALAVLLVSLEAIFPDFVNYLPVGGVTELAEGSEYSFHDWGASDAPVCAPIAGMLQAIATVATGIDGDVRELRCVACGAPRCEFEARWSAC